MYIGVCVAEIVYIRQFVTIINDLGRSPTLEIVQAPSVQYYLYLIFTRINVSVKSTQIHCYFTLTQFSSVSSKWWCGFLESLGAIPWHKISKNVAYSMHDWKFWWEDTINFPTSFLSIWYSAAVTTASVMTTNTIVNMNNKAVTTTVIFNLVYFVPLLFTNLVATSLIGYKFWYLMLKNNDLMSGTQIEYRIYRREIKVHIILEENRGNSVNNILILLTESGLLYCFFWVRKSVWEIFWCIFWKHYF